MTLEIDLSPTTEERLRKMAKARGQDLATYAARVLDAAMLQDYLNEGFENVHEAFRASGMTEDELSDFLEREKHAMRAEKRNRS